ncbi:MAG: hypothetical protein AAGD35_15810 [Actinomycetota bacterium]
MTDQLLSRVTEQWRTAIGGGCRALAWSSAGRLLAIGADGCVLVTPPGEATPPMSPDPVAGVWLGEGRVVVIDAVLGAVLAGSGTTTTVEVDGGRCVAVADNTVAVGGYGAVAVFDPSAVGAGPARPRHIATGVGQSHIIQPLDGSRWAVGGTTGVALVDTVLDRVDVIAELDGVRTLVRIGPQVLAATELGGALHVIDAEDPAASAEVSSRFPPLRHAAVARSGLLVTTSDAELVWWRIDESGRVGDEPDVVAAHTTTITALAAASNGMVATGDASGTIRLWSSNLIDYPVASLALDAEVVETAWAPDGRRLAIATMNGELLVAEVTPGLLA